MNNERRRERMYTKKESVGQARNGQLGYVRHLLIRTVRWKLGRRTPILRQVYSIARTLRRRKVDRQHAIRQDSGGVGTHLRVISERAIELNRDNIRGVKVGAK